MTNTPSRAEAILRILADPPRKTVPGGGNMTMPKYIFSGWVPVWALVEQSIDCAAFRRLGHDSVRRLVHRTLDRLEKDGLVKTEVWRGDERGPVRFARMTKRGTAQCSVEKAPVFDRDSVTAAQKPKPAADQGLRPQKPPRKPRHAPLESDTAMPQTYPFADRPTIHDQPGEQAPALAAMPFPSYAPRPWTKR